ncbi:STING domain-containing protein [Daejeonella sp. JGW-45]|uniref:STING domain-containing protein n=1 Tax=Daejeonella sp. JGW-45 TaxID=3034148 RepID=UPI0023ED87FB|nr:STING domain-containing protein [Daejeonella sp. JGW-45]
MIQHRLFIGSSAEQIPLLNNVAALIGDVAHCIKWTKAFASNKSALDSLMKQTRLADYAILIATKDDLAEKRTDIVMKPRDNVILEFGLFVGFTGLNKCFLLVEKGTDLPSDLHGINLAEFTLEKGKHNSLEIVVEGIKDEIAKSQKVSELGLLPSTALAIGYFNGFIRKVCEEVEKNHSIIVDGKNVRVKSFKITIVIPKNLDDSGVDDFAVAYNKSNSLLKATTYVDAEVGNRRGYPFHFKVDPPEQDSKHPLEIHVSDIPNTLNTIGECLKLYLPSGEIGSNKDLEHLESRELNNFTKVLSYLIKKNNLTKRNVSIEVDVEV